jgi:hypothetical protein
MSHEISRMYATAEAARAAAAELAEEGFDDVHVVTPPSNPDAPVSAIAAQIALGRVALSDAKIYAEGVSKGSSLVTVHTAFGSGMLATSVLDAHEPIASGMPEPAPARMWDEATPLSSALQIDLLWRDATPASRVMGVQPLTGSDCSASGVIGMPLLSNNPAPLSSILGMSTLSRGGTPLSSLIGMPLLTRSKGAMW